jgi:hypothetical protein
MLRGRLCRIYRIIQRESTEVLKYINRVILSEASAVDVTEFLKLQEVTKFSTYSKDEKNRSL